VSERPFRAEQLLARWREAFILSGLTDPLASALIELAEYFSISTEEALQRCRTAVADSRDHWMSEPRDTDEQIARFYDTCVSYIFEHMHWHATYSEGETLANAAAVEMGLRSGARRVLDYGGGVGTNALMFARAGLETAQADLSGPMMEFTKFRFEWRGLPPPRFVDLRCEALPADTFDLVTVVDVLEHVPDPLVTIERIAHSLAPGGRVVVGMGFGADPEKPMHIVHTPWRFLAGARARGLARLRPSEMDPFDFIRVYRRTDRGLVGWASVRLADGIAVSSRRGARRAWEVAGALRRLMTPVAGSGHRL